MPLLLSWHQNYTNLQHIVNTSSISVVHFSENGGAVSWSNGQQQGVDTKFHRLLWCSRMDRDDLLFLWRMRTIATECHHRNGRLVSPPGRVTWALLRNIFAWMQFYEIISFNLAIFRKLYYTYVIFPIINWKHDWFLLNWTHKWDRKRKMSTAHSQCEQHVHHAHIVERITTTVLLGLA